MSPARFHCATQLLLVVDTGSGVELTRLVPSTVPRKSHGQAGSVSISICNLASDFKKEIFKDPVGASQREARRVCAERVTPLEGPALRLSRTRLSDTMIQMLSE